MSLHSPIVGLSLAGLCLHGHHTTSLTVFWGGRHHGSRRSGLGWPEVSSKDICVPPANLAVGEWSSCSKVLATPCPQSPSARAGPGAQGGA